MKFEGIHTEKKVSFLDVDLDISNGIKLCTKVHRKFEGNIHYLKASSCHPPHTIEAMPYGEFIRLHRLYSEGNELIEEMNRTCDMFETRRYDTRALRYMWHKFKKERVERSSCTCKRVTSVD